MVASDLCIVEFPSMMLRLLPVSDDPTLVKDACVDPVVHEVVARPIPPHGAADEDLQAGATRQYSSHVPRMVTLEGALRKNHSMDFRDVSLRRRNERNEKSREGLG